MASRPASSVRVADFQELELSIEVGLLQLGQGIGWEGIGPSYTE